MHWVRAYLAQDLTAPLFSGIADIVDGIVCPSRFHASLVEPESVRSLIRVVSSAEATL